MPHFGSKKHQARCWEHRATDGEGPFQTADFPEGRRTQTEKKEILLLVDMSGPKKRPYPRWFEEQKLISPQFWRLDVSGQDLTQGTF